ncbi:MAG: undecaprenyldiphospho-muramoylpentapeptide beta-N-acetylglucosaminyltransferase [Deltaproteobacteria bacterium]|nr:undecaprenyldiphospho-muramoylpentapeptide beta-N-acetylglucosaminyltransferase [Deltaproteobacteria bacterium]
MKLVMAGGGTGGHLFPALALAEEFKKRDRDTEIIFIGGKGGLEERIVPRYGYPLRVLNVEGIKRRKGFERIRALAKAAKSTVDAIGILRSIRPDGVIGSGSYSSAPVVLAAKILGMKTAILEQNALPGLTNRVLGKVVDRIYIAFEEARVFFPGGRTILTGNPIRKDIMERFRDTFVERNEKFSILVFGGSQGATAINTAFLDAIEYLTDIWSGLRVVHQTGEEGYEAVKAAYRRKDLKVELFKFIDDMAGAYNSADLVVCRAGATSIAEITALGLASILIPYPFAADDHQTVNARCLSEHGASVMIRQDKLTGSALADTIRKLYKNPRELKEIRERVKMFGKPMASEMITDNFLKILNKGRKAAAA